MDAGAAQVPPVSYYDRLQSLVEQVAEHAEQHSTKLFSGLVVTVAVLTMAIALVRYRFELLLLLSCVLIVIFYGTLYLRRRLWLRGRYQHAWLLLGLGHLAVASGAIIMSLFFFYILSKLRLFFMSFPLAIRFWPLVLVGVCLAFALAVLVGYHFYRIFVLPLDEEEEQAAQVPAAAQAASPPV